MKVVHPVVFPILLPTEYSPKEIPWAMLLEHEAQALKNHSQTLAQLAPRGGLSPSEAVAVLDERPWRRMAPEIAGKRLRYLVAIWKNSAGSKWMPGGMRATEISDAPPAIS